MKLNKLLILAALATALQSACTPLTPNLDSTFGKAVNQAKAQQALNPDASRNTAPVGGVSGKEGGLVMDAYYRSLEAPPPATTAINIGGGLSGGN